jgi:putative transposase
MRLVYKFRYPRSEQLDLLAHISKNLYNEANYLVRQAFFANGLWTRYYQLNMLLKESSRNYKLLKAQTSQQILKVLDKNWASFFKAIKDWKQHPEKYKARPRIPRYKDKDGIFMQIFTNQNSTINTNNNQELVLTMSRSFKETYPQFKGPLRIAIPHYLHKDFSSSYQQVRIMPRRKYFEIEIVYHEKEAVNPNLDKDRYLALDLGVNNLVTAVENRNATPFIISGRIVKSVNQFWNKKRAKLMSIKDKQHLAWTQLLDDLTINRNSVVNDYLHKAARFIINYCLANNIGNICVGELKHIKDGVRLGKRNNQTFVNIPLQKFKQLITYKAELVGIKIHEVNEAYTSKCSALDLEAITKHTHYLGRRIAQGLFRGSHYLLNADVNGALNILRKVIGDAFIRKLVDRGCWFQPVRIRDLLHTSHQQFVIQSCTN